jgi:hypothetical protein
MLNPLIRTLENFATFPDDGKLALDKAVVRSGSIAP